MFEKALLDPLFLTGQWQTLQSGKYPIMVTGLPDGQRPQLIWGMRQQMRKPIIAVCANDVEALHLRDEIAAYTGMRTEYFPSRPFTLRMTEAISRDAGYQRIAILDGLLSGQIECVVLSVESLQIPLVPRETFQTAFLNVALGESHNMQALALRLSYMGYTREDRTEEPGQFSVRGDLLDVFPINHTNPIRIEFFGEEVDALRPFDTQTQRSLDQWKVLHIAPATELPLSEGVLSRGLLRINEQIDAARRLLNKKPSTIITDRNDMPALERLDQWTREVITRLSTNTAVGSIDGLIRCFYPQTSSIIEYVPGALIAIVEPGKCSEISDHLHKEQAVVYTDELERGNALPIQRDLLLSYDDITASHKDRVVLLQSITRQLTLSPQTIIKFQGQGMPVFRGLFDTLRQEVLRWKRNGRTIILLAADEGRCHRLSQTLLDYEIFAPVILEDRPLRPGEIVILPRSGGKGFDDAATGMTVVGERELFGTYKSRAYRRARKKTSADFLSDLRQGELVVHELHGIGRFDGLVKMETGTGTRDYLKIQYSGTDVLYIPTEQMDRIQKYIGNEDSPPRLSRLDSREWSNLKRKVQSSIEDIADDLLRLYATRQMARGHAYSPDTVWQKQFEDNFPYEETPDQLTCIQEIKDDMQSGRPMDRLLCGDVGYGKTEVALRAVFKATMDHKQTAFLAPTTILAHQHFLTMQERFSEFGIEVAELSRFVPPAQVKKTLEQLALGKVDVVVGTHRLLSKDVMFHDLGLLVIDEEQRFGVRHKERIKEMKENICVLTLTATPIPRTLHMSMSGIRDISVIDTPPEERYPVQTFVMEYDDNLVRDAILREMGRSGQVFFLYNRVETMDIMRNHLQELVPEARIVVAHGQMRERDLENVMMEFVAGAYDVLLCTTIIESGIDLPHVNTLVVYDADRMGLSQLYQLRGRVGRSNRLAYAYLTWRREKVLSEIAEKRLNTIREFTEFGSGFKIALRDMEIRGTGNLLGSQQSGHISAVGYGLYCKLVDETMRHLKGEIPLQKVDTTLNIQVDAFLPDDYITSSENRLEIYRRISMVDSPAGKTDMIDELIDRFGSPPESVLRLIDVAYLKFCACRAAIIMVRQQDTKWHLKYSNQFMPDPLKLLNVVSEWQSCLSLVNGDIPSLVLRLPASIDPLPRVIDLLTDLFPCVEESEPTKQS